MVCPSHWSLATLYFHVNSECFWSMGTVCTADIISSMQGTWRRCLSCVWTADLSQWKILWRIVIHAITKPLLLSTSIRIPERLYLLDGRKQFLMGLSELSIPPIAVLILSSAHFSIMYCKPRFWLSGKAAQSQLGQNHHLWVWAEDKNRSGIQNHVAMMIPNELADYVRICHDNFVLCYSRVCLCCVCVWYVWVCCIDKDISRWLLIYAHSFRLGWNRAKCSVSLYHNGNFVSQ